jgi:hypothetical protein
VTADRLFGTSCRATRCTHPLVPHVSAWLVHLESTDPYLGWGAMLGADYGISKRWALFGSLITEDDRRDAASVDTRVSTATAGARLTVCDQGAMCVDLAARILWSLGGPAARADWLPLLGADVTW